MADRDVEVLVIGAGPTGLGAAVRLREHGIDHVVVDGADRVGGMAASYLDDAGFTWDLGGHVIHSHFAAFDEAIARSGVSMRHVHRNGCVWLSGKDPTSFLPTPIQEQLQDFPPDINPGLHARNLAEYYRNSFGAALTEEFFRGYNEKMWSVPLEEVDHVWTSLRNGGNGRNVPQLGLAKDFEPSTELFPYPRGGTGALWSAIRATLVHPDAVQLGCAVERLYPQEHLAVLTSGEIVRYRFCISSAPATWILRAAGLDRAAARLVASSELAVGLGLRGDPPEILADKSWIYSPDSTVAWFRATMLSNYDPANAGPGRWSVLFEATSFGRDLSDPQEVGQQCLESLAPLGVEAADLDSMWLRRIERGYPVPTLGRDQVLQTADATLRELDIYTRGRFGGWRYESCNQDYAYMQGRQAVDAIFEDSLEEVYWHPERF